MEVTNDPDFVAYAQEHFIIDEDVEEVTADEDDSGYFSDGSLPSDEREGVTDDNFLRQLYDDIVDKLDFGLVGLGVGEQGQKGGHNLFDQGEEEDDEEDVFYESTKFDPKVAKRSDEHPPGKQTTTGGDQFNDESSHDSSEVIQCPECLKTPPEKLNNLQSACRELDDVDDHLAAGPTFDEDVAERRNTEDESF